MLRSLVAPVRYCIGRALSRACRTRCTCCADAPEFRFQRTMRVDYFHRGGPAGKCSSSTVIAEGAWPGSRTQLVDTTDLGKYFFEVIDRASNRVLYSRGFATIYGEWETTPEFRTKDRTFHESVRFPWPAAPVRVAIKKRDRRTSSGRCGNSTSIPRCRGRSIVAGAAHDLDGVRERTAEPEGRPAAHQRRVFLGGGGEISL